MPRSAAEPLRNPRTDEPPASSMATWRTRIATQSGKDAISVMSGSTCAALRQHLWLSRRRQAAASGPWPCAFRCRCPARSAWAHLSLRPASRNTQCPVEITRVHSEENSPQTAAAYADSFDFCPFDFVQIVDTITKLESAGRYPSGSPRLFTATMAPSP